MRHPVGALVPEGILVFNIHLVEFRGKLWLHTTEVFPLLAGVMVLMGIITTRMAMADGLGAWVGWMGVGCTRLNHLAAWALGAGIAVIAHGAVRCTGRALGC